MDSSWPDLNQEPERHNTYSFREPPMSNSYFNQEQPVYTSIPLMNAIPHEFHPYVRNITDVIGDGNCGFRAIALSIGRSEHDWHSVRCDLYNELLAHPEEYAVIFDNYYERIRHSLNFSGSGFAIREYWLIMPDTAMLIANKYGVIVIYLSNEGSSTWFPLRYGPQHIPNPAYVVIAHVYGDHYVMVDLHGTSPMPPVLSRLLHVYRSQYSAEWETLYSARLNAYVPRVVPRNCNTEPFIIPD